MCAKVIHFGCGALGLGLSVPILKDLPNREIFLANRRNPNPEDNAKNEILRSQKSYNLICGDNTAVIDFTDFIYFDEFNKLEQLFLEDDFLFITTALKETGIKANLPLFSSLISLRNKSKIRKPLIFLACENAISSTDIEKLIKDHLKIDHKSAFQNPEILFMDCVVDRMCNSPLIKNNAINVVVEDYCSWIVNPANIKRKLAYNDPNYVSLLGQINQLSDDLEMIYNIQFFVRRKKWIINAMHQMIALYAHYLDRNLIHLFVKSNGGKDIVSAIERDVLKMYLYNEENASEDEAIKYIKKFIERISNYPSLISTALTRFQDGSKLQEFFADFHRKTGEPALHYTLGTGEDLPAVNQILLIIVEMISKKKYVGK